MQQRLSALLHNDGEHNPRSTAITDVDGNRPGTRRYYYEYNSGLQAQSALYTMASLDDFDNAMLVFDPNALSKDGTVAVNGYAFNWGGDLIAYNIARHAALQFKMLPARMGPQADPIKWICVSVCLCTGLIALDIARPAACFLRMY